jgi:RNA polymerase sigma-70 factor (ECF subfamily)
LEFAEDCQPRGLACVLVNESRNQELSLDVQLEKTVVASCKAGDKAAYAGLVEAYAGRVFAICLGMLGNRQDAEDVAQQALLKGFVEIRSLRDSDRFGPWIAQIARNLCLDVVRKRKPPLVLPPVVDNVEQVDTDEYRRLEAALAKLDTDYRVPLLLFYFEGRSTKSIGEALGATQGTIQTRLSRARKQLRQWLATEGDVP